MGIERIVALIPEERRREAGDRNVGGVAVEAGQEHVLRERAEIPALVLNDAFRDAIFVAQRPARLEAGDARRLDESAALPDVRLRAEVVVLERRDLNGDVVAADEGLAVGEEDVLPVRACVDQLQPEIAAGAEEIAMSDGRRGE